MAAASGVLELLSPTDSKTAEESKTASEARSFDFVPTKEMVKFRVYDKAQSEWDEGVYRHYKLMRQNQTVAFVDRLAKKYHNFDHAEMTVWEAFEKLKGYVDSSDPDITLPNLEHMLQTAERARAAGKSDWFQLICLIHDMGKVMFLWGEAADGQVGTAEGPQFALGGDTWVVGCRLPDGCIYPELNALNPDMRHPVYSTPLGKYSPACGIMNLQFAYGHDEYIYRFALHNRIPFPAEGLAILRLHSCYPWHKWGEYRQFMAPGDEALLEAVLHFNQFDLYSKSDERPDVEKLWPYYQSLIDKYMPGKLKW